MGRKKQSVVKQSFIEKNSLKIILFALAFVPLLLYIRTSGYEFVWDDEPLYINVKHFPPENTFRNFTDFWSPAKTGMYAPVTYAFWTFAASMAVNPNNAVQKFNPEIFHLLNVIFHILNGILVFLILFKLIKNHWAAFGGALLFAVHPVQVEAVAWVSELRGLLCAFFGLFFLFQFLQYRAYSELHQPVGEKIPFTRSKSYIYLVAVLSLILSLLSKPSGVVFPVIAVLLDFLYFRKSLKDTIKTNIIFFVLLIPSAVISNISESQSAIQFAAPVWARPMIFLDTINFYIFQVFYPLGLAVSYGRTPEFVINSPWLYLSWILSVVISVIIWYYRKKAGYFLLAFLIYILGYLPVSGLVTFYYQYMSTTADRYIYISMLGAALAFSVLLTKIKNRKNAAIFASVVLIVMIFLSNNQIPVWSNEFSMWSKSIEKYPESSPHPYSGRGLLYQEQKKYREAIEDFNKAIELKPDYGQAYYNRGNAYYDLGIYNKAIEDFSKSIKINPKFSEAYLNRGLSLAAVDRHVEAINDYSVVLSLNPENKIDVYNNRGVSFARLGKFDSAASDFRKALEIKPDDKDAAYNLKMALEEIEKNKKKE